MRPLASEQSAAYVVESRKLQPIHCCDGDSTARSIAKRGSGSFAELEVPRENQKPLISSLSHLADFVRSAAPGQMHSDSDKTYGITRSDMVRHQTYGNPGIVVSLKIPSFFDRATTRLSFRELNRKNCLNRRCRTAWQRRLLTDAEYGLLSAQARSPVSQIDCVL